MAVQDLRGHVLGRYRLVTELGSGGMGTVYYAEHVSIGRRAAVKVLDPALSRDASLVARFFTEARAVNALRHPHIVDIEDLAHEGDLHYLVMELLEGETLGARLERQKRLALPELLTLIGPVANALEAVHKKGMVHRDLKPENMFLAKDVHDREVPKLLDFGIVKLASGDHGGRTQAGLLLGTPAYMSPEQCAGITDLDARSDVYSLGVVLYEALTGRLPFVRSNVLGLLSAHQCETPLPPIRLRGDLPPRVSEVIAQALAKLKEDRPAGALALFNTLEEASREAAVQHERVERKRVAQTKNVGGKVAEIVGQRIAQGTLVIPSMPEACMQCMELLRRKNVRMKDVAERVRRDPLLSTRILMVASSSALGSRERVVDVETALVRLGIETTRGIVVEMAARQVFVSRDARLRDRLRAIWERSVAVSIAAGRLVDEIETPVVRGEAQSAGLLAEIGHPILAALLLDVERSSETKAGDAWITDEVFAAVVAQHGPRLGARVAGEWALDPAIIETIEGLDGWSDEPGSLRDVVRMAAELAGAAGFLAPGCHGADDEVRAEGRRRLGLDAGAEARLVEALPALVAEQLGTKPKDSTPKTLQARASVR